MVFAWWGAHAKNLRAEVDRLTERFPGVSIEHVSHCNPAAQGFLANTGQRTLFKVDALAPVSIRRYSAFRGEEE